MLSSLFSDNDTHGTHTIESESAKYQSLQNSHGWRRVVMARAVQQYFVYEPRSRLTLPLTSIWVRAVPRSLTSTPLRRGPLAWLALPRDTPPRHRLCCGALPGLAELHLSSRCFTEACLNLRQLAVVHGASRRPALICGSSRWFTVPRGPRGAILPREVSFSPAEPCFISQSLAELCNCSRSPDSARGALTLLAESWPCSRNLARVPLDRHPNPLPRYPLPKII